MSADILDIFFPFAPKIDFWPNKSVNIYNIFFLIYCKYRSSEMQLKKKTQQKLLVLALSFQWSETEWGRGGRHKMSPGVENRCILWQCMNSRGGLVGWRAPAGA